MIETSPLSQMTMREEDAFVLSYHHYSIRQLQIPLSRRCEERVTGWHFLRLSSGERILDEGDSAKVNVFVS